MVTRTSRLASFSPNGTCSTPSAPTRALRIIRVMINPPCLDYTRATLFQAISPRPLRPFIVLLWPKSSQASKIPRAAFWREPFELAILINALEQRITDYRELTTDYGQ